MSYFESNPTQFRSVGFFKVASISFKSCFQNQNMNYMMNQMGPNMGPGPPGGNMRFGGPQPGMGPRGPPMGPRGQGFQSIPPSGPMMRQQAASMMGNGGPGDMSRMRFPHNPMMGPGGGPGGPGVGPGPQKVPVSHPSPQHGSPAGMWNNMGSGSPNPNGMQMQQSIGSPRTPGERSESLQLSKSERSAIRQIALWVICEAFKVEHTLMSAA